MALKIRPVNFSEAADFVTKNHRHHKAPIGHKFSIACYDGEKRCGVAMVGRPVSRHLDDGETLEVNRLCTDGTKNACSMLYSTAWRAAKALGYTRIFTYTLQSESGASLRAAGWVSEGEAGGLSWTGKRYDQTALPMVREMKVRWKKEIILDG